LLGNEVPGRLSEFIGSHSSAFHVIVATLVMSPPVEWDEDLAFFDLAQFGRQLGFTVTGLDYHEIAVLSVPKGSARLNLNMRDSSYLP
jgi:hypothetical protein